MTITLYPTPGQKDAIDVARKTRNKAVIIMCWSGLLASYGHPVCNIEPRVRFKSDLGWVIEY